MHPVEFFPTCGRKGDFLRFIIFSLYEKIFMGVEKKISYDEITELTFSRCGVMCSLHRLLR